MRSPVNNQISVPSPVRFTFDYPTAPMPGMSGPPFNFFDGYADRKINMRIAENAEYTQGLRVVNDIRENVRDIALELNKVYYYSFIYVLEVRFLLPNGQRTTGTWIGSQYGRDTFEQTWIFRTNANVIPTPVIVPDPPPVLPPTTTPPAPGAPPSHTTPEEQGTIQTISAKIADNKVLTAILVISGIAAIIYSLAKK